MNTANRYALVSLAGLLAMSLVRDDELSARAAEQAIAQPDFSGVWQPNPKESTRWPEERPYTKKMAETRALWLKNTTPADLTEDDDHQSCLPYTLPYMLSTVITYPFEIVMTPKRIYIYKESYGQFRRIDMDAPPAIDRLPSRTGVSRGHWEGAELVIETTNILAENETSRFPSSPALRVTERMSVLEGGEFGKQIVNVVTLTDPLVYDKPIVLKMVYKPLRGWNVDEYICQQDLWDQQLEGDTNRLPWR